MKKQHKIAKEIKDQVIERIRNQGVSVTQAAQEHGIGTNTIYAWLSKRTDAGPNILEIAKLKKENQALKELIGEITLQMSRSQKKT